jgi:hypothetical protein
VPARPALVPVLLAAMLGLAGVLPGVAAAGSAAASARWVRPVAGAVTRGFDPGPDPFAAGRHRGVDLAAAPGSGVRAPCAGRVVVAGRIGSSGGVVTVACGPWRVSVLPLRSIGVLAGQFMPAGAPVGAAGASSRHAGLHLGVRRAGRPFGYVDPLRFLGRGGRPAPPGPVGPRGRTRPRAAPLRAAPPAPVSGAAPLPLAPWPAWAGLAGLLVAAAGRAARTRPPGAPRRVLRTRGAAGIAGRWSR